MNVANAALLMWIPCSAFLFAVMKPARAVVAAYLIGWLLLPVAEIDVRGFFDVDKVLATNVGVLIGAVVFAHEHLYGFRPHRTDLLLLVFGAGVWITSITNGLGAYNGLSQCAHKILYYAIPFWLGRLMIRSRSELREAARTVVIVAAVAGVLAVWEWRMSPQIHRFLYGYFQHSFHQHVRWGHFRPIICFPHALALGTFLAWTSVMAIWMLKHKLLRPIWAVPAKWIVALIPIGLLASMSVGPHLLFCSGIGLIYLWKGPNRRWLLNVPVLFAMLWMAGRYVTASDVAPVTSTLSNVSEERAESLEYRLRAEVLLLEKARQRPLFGWGGFGRNRVADESGHEVATDSLWIILIGMFGSFGLAVFYLWWCWPIFMTRRTPATLEGEPVVMALVVAVAMQAVNFLFNAFLSPVLILMSGAAIGAMRQMRESASARSTAGDTRILQKPPLPLWEQAR